MPALRSLLPVMVFTLLYAALSLSVSNSYYQLILTLVPVWAVFGLSWNLLSGYTGLISFGHAAFFGIGAYTVALGQIYFDLSPWVLIPIAAMLGGLAGLLIGFPTFRLQGHYFALAMLAYPLAILYVFEWLGFQEITLPIKRDHPIAYMQFGDPRIYTLLALAMVLATILLTLRIESSRFGMALRAIKQNEAAAEAAGINTLAWKLRAIVLSGAIAGAIGGILCRGAAGGDPAVGIRHAGVGAGADGCHVRRRRNGLGSGDRLRDPHPAGRNAQRRSGLFPSRHSGRDLRARHHLRHTGRARGAVLEVSRFLAQAIGDARHGEIRRARSSTPGCSARRRSPSFTGTTASRTIPNGG